MRPVGDFAGLASVISGSFSALMLLIGWLMNGHPDTHVCECSTRMSCTSTSQWQLRQMNTDSDSYSYSCMCERDLTLILFVFTLLPLFSTKSFQSFSLLIRSSSFSAITTRSSAYNNSHDKATVNSLDKASVTIKNSKGLNAEP